MISERYPALATAAQVLGAHQISLTWFEAYLNGTLIHVSIDERHKKESRLFVSFEHSHSNETLSPIKIMLRAESAVDKAGKQRLINEEVQTDDYAFDEAVYIDTNATAVEVRNFLGDEKLRRACLSLVNTGATIEITPAQTRAKWQLDSGISLLTHEQMVHRAKLVSQLSRSDAPSGDVVRSRGAWVVPLAAIFAGISVILSISALAGYWCGWPLPMLGFIVGLFIALPLRPLVARFVAGNSDSFARYRKATLLLFVGVPLLFAAIVTSLNGGLSQGDATVRRGFVSTDATPTKKSECRFTVKWQDEEREQFSLACTQPIFARTKVRRLCHNGGLIKSMVWCESLTFD
jgi:hypothetical protein